jgi:hypothetical protein
MQWTVSDAKSANHNPEVVLNGRPGKAPLTIETTVANPVTLDATGTRDPDGNALRYRWFFYPEAGTGIPGQPVFAGGLTPIGGGGTPGEGGVPSAPEGGPREPAPRIVLQDPTSPRVTVIPRTAGTAHIILEVQDDGTPMMTSYRRVILSIKGK